MKCIKIAYNKEGRLVAFIVSFLDDIRLHVTGNVSEGISTYESIMIHSLLHSHLITNNVTRYLYVVVYVQSNM